MKRVQIFEDKRNCCGCSACMNACSQSAIEMKEDEFGFVYPEINRDKCINCGKCKTMCAYQNDIILNEVKTAYAGVSLDQDIIPLSSSGGVFASLAKNVLCSNGVVYGCSLEIEDSQLFPKHIEISSTDQLYKLQGSKYVQSTIGMTYQNIKNKLDEGTIVLFSGTPCQVAGLKGFLKHDYQNLYTIDIVCHGVPSYKMFRDYIEQEEQSIGKPIVGINFRYKEKNWGSRRTRLIFNANGTANEKIIDMNKSPYYTYYMDGVINRENCYSCKYAGIQRPADLTIGDFWGIEKVHPDYMVSNGGLLDKKNGVSCVLVNNVKGEKILREFGSNILLYESNLEKVTKYNTQLCSPCPVPRARNKVMEIYKKKGYYAIEKMFRRYLIVKKINDIFSRLKSRMISHKQLT